MLVSLASIAVNFAAAFAMVERWAGMGHAGLALSTSLVALFGAVALFRTLARRIGGLMSPHLCRARGESPPASAVMGAASGSRACGPRAAGAAEAGAARGCRDLDPARQPWSSILLRAALRVPELEALRTACYTAFRNAPRPEAGDPPARNR